MNGRVQGVVVHTTAHTLTASPERVIQRQRDQELLSIASKHFMTANRVLYTVSVSANHPIKNETEDSKDPVAVGKKQIT